MSYYAYSRIRPEFSRNVIHACWDVRRRITTNFWVWWFEHRPVDWKDTIICYSLTAIMIGFLAFFVGVGIWGFMVTECG